MNRERLISDLSASIRGAGTIVRGMTEWLEAFETITERVHRGTPISIAELELIAQWNGIAIGVLASRSADVTRARNSRASLAAFYDPQVPEKSTGVGAVLLALDGLGPELLRVWMTDDALPECRLLAEAELYRRGLGPNPFERIGAQTRGAPDGE